MGKPTTNTTAISGLSARLYFSPSGLFFFSPDPGANELEGAEF